tara:strand:- start:345 stop:641 length:297 start_codon:yes stop_codon:yes gene_type:complete
MIIKIALIILSIFLIISLYYNYKFALIIINTQDAIENSLDILDDRYNKIQNLINTPILYDSPQIKKLVLDMKDCRDSILEVANVMVNDNRIDTGDSDG